MIGAFLQHKGFEIYTDMNKVLEPIQEDFKQYNWLITDYEGGFLNEFLDCGKYIWLAGEELLDLTHHHFEIHFTWEVFSAIPKSISLDQVLISELLFSDGYRGFWVNPLSFIMKGSCWN